MFGYVDLEKRVRADRLLRVIRATDTHASKTDRDAQLYRKGCGTEAQQCFMGYAPMENRNGLIVGAVMLSRVVV